MKNYVISLFLGVFLVGSLGLTFASGSLNEKSKANTKTAYASSEVGNKICPISGQAVGTMGEIIKYEYNGKIYNLCCPGCEKDFSKNPQKYTKIAEDEIKS